MVLKGAFLSLKMEAEKNVKEQASLVFLFTTLSLYPSVPLFFYIKPNIYMCVLGRWVIKVYICVCVCVCVCMLSSILFLCVVSQNIENTSLCCTLRAGCLSIL